MAYTLRAVGEADLDRLFDLLSIPDVYAYLSDGVAPDRAIVAAWVTEALQAAPPQGLWILEEAPGEAAGCVRLSAVEDGSASAELTYVLHPSVWGRGLATTMSRTVIARAFETPTCQTIFAGADAPNARSIEVMKRLGMRAWREVSYPAGLGVEYLLHRDAFDPTAPKLAWAERLARGLCGSLEREG